VHSGSLAERSSSLNRAPQVPVVLLSGQYPSWGIHPKLQNTQRLSFALC